MKLYAHVHLKIFFTSALFATCCLLSSNAQEGAYLVDDPLQPQLDIPDLEVKVTWIDSQGKKRRTKGYLMVALDNRLLVRGINRAGRNTQHTFPVSIIHKIKYSRPYNEASDILYGAADGLLSGGFVPVQTGNVYVDLASGLVQGALSGFIGTLGNSTSIVVAGNEEIYRARVLPDLRPVPIGEPILTD